MALPPSTANWHWKNKNVTRWGKEWFERELPSLAVQGDREGELISISKVTSVDGDVELGQRKSKLITIYDCHLTLEWEGTMSDGSSISGRLNIPEVSHEITLDGLSDYTYEWSIKDSTPAVEALLSLAKPRMQTLLENAFKKFPADIIEMHGKDLTVSTEPSRAATPTISSASVTIPTPTPSTPPPPKPATKAEDRKVTNTTTISTEATFMASADDLYSLLTDEKRIPSWSRAAAQSTAKPDLEYSLFGGGVKGKYISVKPPTEIVQTWALQSPTWPTDHYGTLTTSLEQSTDSTKVTFSLSGVPTGLEDEIRRNVDGYYVHGIKSIGLGTVL